MGQQLWKTMVLTLVILHFWGFQPHPRNSQNTGRNDATDLGEIREGWVSCKGKAEDEDTSYKMTHVSLTDLSGLS